MALEIAGLSVALLEIDAPSVEPLPVGVARGTLCIPGRSASAA